jgi:hypothetical protein
MGDTYADLEILAEVADDDYLIRISKADLNTLVTFSKELNIRHWDGKQPTKLEAYSETAVRTRGDTKSYNNLSKLPKVGEHRLTALLENL